MKDLGYLMVGCVAVVVVCVRAIFKRVTDDHEGQI